MQVTSATTTSNATTQSELLSSRQTSLTQKDFLQLLVAQMQNQNPTNPQSSTDMAAQMAQFSSLQQTTDMSSSLSMLQASSLLGSTVNLQLDSKTLINGVVQGVVMQNGTPKILVNDSAYDLSKVISIAPTPVASPTNPSSPPQ